MTINNAVKIEDLKVGMLLDTPGGPRKVIEIHHGEMITVKSRAWSHGEKITTQSWNAGALVRCCWRGTHGDPRSQPMTYTFSWRGAEREYELLIWSDAEGSVFRWAQHLYGQEGPWVSKLVDGTWATFAWVSATKTWRSVKGNCKYSPQEVRVPRQIKAGARKVVGGHSNPLRDDRTLGI